MRLPEITKSLVQAHTPSRRGVDSAQAQQWFDRISIEIDSGLLLGA